jgi:transglutaminase-like putative cysteine protease
MRSPIILVYLFCLLLIPPTARATPPAEQWFTVLLDGRKIGSFESRREVRQGKVTTTQILDLGLDRLGIRVALRNEESSTETVDGKPLSFRSAARLSGGETVNEGRVHDGVIDLATSGDGDRHQRRMPWPKSALLAEGQRLAGVRAGLTAGTRYEVLAFDPSSLDASKVTSVIGAEEDVDLPQGRMRLFPLEQTAELSGTPMKTREWIDAEQTVHKLTLPIMGVELTMLACDRTCATAPNQGTDVFERTLLRSPQPLTAGELRGAIRYTLVPREPGVKLALPETDEQRVQHKAGEAIVTVRPNPRPGAEAKPEPDDYAPNDWLQSQAPEVVQLAKKAAGNATSSRERMRNIETFVRGYIRTKSLDVGYASALEVVRKPEGDCTEHAVLVAALGRALGIATRVVDGFAYAPGFGGKQQVFVPHAWAQAYVDEHWKSFDAALPGFDTGHIAISIGNGDPWRFYSGLDLLGRLDMRQVEPVARLVP